MSKKQPPKPPKPKKPNPHDLGPEYINLHRLVIGSTRAPFKESIDDYIIQSGVILCEAARVAIQKYKNVQHSLNESVLNPAHSLAFPQGSLPSSLRRRRPKVTQSSKPRKLGVNRLRNSKLAAAGKRLIRRVSDVSSKIAASPVGKVVHKAAKAYTAVVRPHTYTKIGRSIAKRVGVKLKTPKHPLAKHGTAGLADRLQKKMKGHATATAAGVATPSGIIGATIGGALAGPAGAGTGFAVGHFANDIWNTAHAMDTARTASVHGKVKKRWERMKDAAKQGRAYGDKRRVTESILLNYFYRRQQNRT